MAKLIMSDGSVRNVSYDTAAKILQVLHGVKEPEDQKQADFVAQVADVDFNDGYQVMHAKKPSKIDTKDPELRAIVNDKTIRGYSKFQAVGQKLKERRDAKREKNNSQD